MPHPTTTTQQTSQRVAPVMPEPKPAVPVSTPTAISKVNPVLTPTTALSVAPVQPQRSGHTHAVPKTPDYRVVTEDVTASGSINDYLTWNAHEPL